MFKNLKNKICYMFLVFVFLNTNIAYSFDPSRIITDENGIKTYEYDLRCDEYDKNLNLIINKDWEDMYVLNEIPTHDSKYKETKPDDSEDVLSNKKAYNNEVSRLKLKFSELELYLESLKAIIDDNEKNLILKYLPELMDDKIYFDGDYNDVSVSDMNIIYNALIKIYDAVKITAEPQVYSEYWEYDKYIYGYNIDFLRSNIKSLKNALKRKNIYKIDEKNLVETKHNKLLDELYYFDATNAEVIKTRFKIASVSNLIDDTYYNVILEPIDNYDIDIREILYDLKENDTIKVICKDYDMTYQFTNKIVDTGNYKEYEFYVNTGDYFYVYDRYDGSRTLIYLEEDANFAVKVYKNAVCLTLYQYLINNYVAYDKLEDKFYDNIELENNLFDNVDKTKIMVTDFDFDEKGYVKSLINIKEQYE